MAAGRECVLGANDSLGMEPTMTDSGLTWFAMEYEIASLTPTFKAWDNQVVSDMQLAAAVLRNEERRNKRRKPIP